MLGSRSRQHYACQSRGTFTVSLTLGTTNLKTAVVYFDFDPTTIYFIFSPTYCSCHISPSTAHILTDGQSL